MDASDMGSTGSAKPNWDFAALSHLAAVLTPLIVGMTGMFYVSGHTFRASYLLAFGLDHAFSENSIQSTLAVGFPIAMVGLMVVSVIGAVIFLLETGLDIASAKYEDSILSRYKAFRMLMLMKRANAVTYKVFLGLIYLLSGFLSGGIIGEYKAHSLMRNVRNNCEAQCFIVETDRGRFIGGIVEQDQQRIAVFEKTGTRLLDTKTVKRIKPIEPAE